MFVIEGPSSKYHVIVKSSLPGSMDVVVIFKDEPSFNSNGPNGSIDGATFFTIIVVV